jgi:signal transduction histidine kinase
VTIQIKDEGSSLSDENLERLFFKFADVGSYATAKENTSKLGLQMAKLLIDMHKGKIWAERAEGNTGTIFCVQLPLK